MPSLSLAVAVRVIDAGAVNVAPFAGAVSDADGGRFDGVSVTLSNVAVQFTPLTWLDTARPTNSVVPIDEKVSLAT